MSQTFDPNAAALAGSGIFGLPYTEQEARALVLPIAFDATTSYRKGTARGPEAVIAASRQVDLYDIEYGRIYEVGIALLESDARIDELQREATELADPIIARGGAIEGDAVLAAGLARVNAIGEELNARVRSRAEGILARGKLPVLLGGDHSTPFGGIAAAAAAHPGLGVLHFDAHADLRRAYEGFTWSHASIFWNVMERVSDVSRLVQVGIRDFSEEEHELAAGSGGRIHTLYDREWAEARLAGRNLLGLVRATLERLPREVWVSFDVDGLEPTLCPNTGTPVPGGLAWHEALLWLRELAQSGRRVVGLDLNEVSPGPEGDPEGRSWDAIVGARLLYKLIGAATAR